MKDNAKQKERDEHVQHFVFKRVVMMFSLLHHQVRHSGSKTLMQGFKKEELLHKWVEMCDTTCYNDASVQWNNPRA